MKDCLGRMLHIAGGERCCQIAALQQATMTLSRYQGLCRVCSFFPGSLDWWTSRSAAYRPGFAVTRTHAVPKHGAIGSQMCLGCRDQHLAPVQLVSKDPSWHSMLPPSTGNSSTQLGCLECDVASRNTVYGITSDMRGHSNVSTSRDIGLEGWTSVTVRT